MSFLRQLVDEINKVRRNPSSYISKLENYKSYFNGKILKLPNQNVAIRTQEGADGYDECIRFLGSAEACEKDLIPSKGLTKIANELLAVVQKDASKIGGVDMNEIIDRYGSFSGAFNRLMECGGATPDQVVVNLLVSDGDKNRSQRNVLLNKSVHRIGVASGEHDVYRHASIVILCTTFTSNVDSNDNETYGGASYGSSSDSSYGGSSYSQPRREEPRPAPQTRPPQQQPRPAPQTNDSSLPLLKQKIVEKPAADSGPTEDENIVSVDKAERVVVEGGKRKKKITYTKHYKDGHTEKEVKFENL